MTSYHPIDGSESYEYRYVDSESGSMSSWQAGGAANAETLAQIGAGLTSEDYQVRKLCHVADDQGTYAGMLIFAHLVKPIGD